MSISSLIGIGSNNLGPRFNLVGIIPSTFLILFIFMLLVIGGDRPTTTPNFGTVLDKVVSLDLSQGAILILVVVFLSFIIQPLQRPIVRLLEGYWGTSWLAQRFFEFGVGIQREKFRNMQNLASPYVDKNTPAKQMNRIHRKMFEAEQFLIDHYPTEDRLLPTAFGNILRAAEDLAGYRYGLSTGATWPRLYPVLSDNVKSIADDARNQLDVAVRFCFVFIIAAISSTVVYFVVLYNASNSDLPLNLLIYNQTYTNAFDILGIWISLAVKYGSWLIIPALTSIVAILFYRSSLSAAMSYGSCLKTAFDLQRFELIKALHLPLPANSDEEKTSNAKLSDFLRDRHTGTFPYTHNEEKD